jgi:hypothetical protein
MGGGGYIPSRRDTQPAGKMETCRMGRVPSLYPAGTEPAGKMGRCWMGRVPSRYPAGGQDDDVMDGRGVVTYPAGGIPSRRARWGRAGWVGYPAATQPKAINVFFFVPNQ